MHGMRRLLFWVPTLGSSIETAYTMKVSYSENRWNLFNGVSFDVTRAVVPFHGVTRDFTRDANPKSGCGKLRIDVTASSPQISKPSSLFH